MKIVIILIGTFSTLPQGYFLWARSNNKNMENRKLVIICTLGRGGSGKDTQVELFTEEKLRDGKKNSNYLSESIKISTGDIIRKAQVAGEILYDKYYEDLKPYLEDSNSGGLIPDEIVLNIVEREIAHLYLGGKRIFFFTGFPRTYDQLNSFCKWLMILENDGIKTRVLFVDFHVDEQISRNRAKARREAAVKNGEKVRKDDDEKVVEKRLKTFRDYTEKMLEKLAEKDSLVKIEANRTIEEIFEDFKREVEKVIKG